MAAESPTEARQAAAARVRRESRCYKPNHDASWATDLRARSAVRCSALLASFQFAGTIPEHSFDYLFGSFNRSCSSLPVRQGVAFSRCKFQLTSEKTKVYMVARVISAFALFITPYKRDPKLKFLIRFKTKFADSLIERLFLSIQRE